jgi:hypothetical protein
MSTNEFKSIFESVWSILAISGGLCLIFFYDWFISSNSRTFLNLYKKTNINLFRNQAKEMEKPYMKILVRVLGVAFVVLGFLTLLGVTEIGLL